MMTTAKRNAFANRSVCISFCADLSFSVKIVIKVERDFVICMSSYNDVDDDDGLLLLVCCLRKSARYCVGSGCLNGQENRIRC